MKKILLILSIILLTACNNVEQPVDNDDKENKQEENVASETLKFKEEYEALNSSGIVVEVDSNVNIEYLKTSEVIDLLENKTGIIYFGFPSCPWCRNIVPILFDVAKENNQAIYYFNPSGLRGTGDGEFNKIMTLLNDYLETNDEGEKTLYVPDVYFVKDGSIVGHHLGSAPSQTNPYVSLTENQKQELINIYKELINKIKED